MLQVILLHGELLETGVNQCFQCLCAHLLGGEDDALRELVADERLGFLGILGRCTSEKQQKSGRALRTSSVSASCITSRRAVLISVVPFIILMSNSLLMGSSVSGVKST